jgi:hypothetical protein
MLSRIYAVWDLLDKNLELAKEMEIGYVVVSVDALIFATLDKEILQESQWILSKKPDWFSRVDPANPQLKQQRH